MPPDVFAKNHLRIVGEAPGQVDDRLASPERFSDAFPIGQIPLHIWDALELLRPGGPVEDPDFFSPPGKIPGQVTADIAPAAGNQDTHSPFPIPLY